MRVRRERVEYSHPWRLRSGRLDSGGGRNAAKVPIRRTVGTMLNIWRIPTWWCLIALGGCDLFAPPVEPGEAEVGAEAAQHAEAPFDGGPFADREPNRDPDA